MKTITKKKLLRLKSIKYVSLVDQPANEHSYAILKRSDGPDEVTATARVVKIDETLGVLIGFANASTVGGEGYEDLQGDVTSEDELIKVCLEYAESGAPVDEMHDEQPVDGARTVFLFPLTSELAKSLGIGEVQKTGILIGIKVSPEIIERARRGEINGFSIGGIGIREPLDDSDSRAEAAKAKLERQVKQAADDLAHEQRLVAEMHAYLDELEQKYGSEAAERAAKANANSVGAWGQKWLDARAEKLAKAAKEQAEHETTPEGIYKTAMSAFAKCASDYHAYVAAVAKQRYMSPSAAGAALYKERDPQYLDLAAAYNKAERYLFEAPIQNNPQLRALAERAAAARAALDAMIEDFAIAHNIDHAEARKRLATISSRYRDLEAEWKAAEMERQDVAARLEIQMRERRMAEYVATTGQLAAAPAPAPDLLTKQSPAMAEFFAELEKYAKARGKDPRLATSEFLHTELGADLYVKATRPERVQ